MTLQRILRKMHKEKLGWTIFSFLFGYMMLQLRGFRLEINLDLLKTLIFPLIVWLISYVFISKIRRVITFELVNCFIEEISDIAIIFPMYLSIQELPINFFLIIFVMLVCIFVSIQISHSILMSAFDRSIELYHINLANGTWNIANSINEENNEKTNWVVIIIIFILLLIASRSFYFFGGTLREFILLAYILFSAVSMGRKLNWFLQFLRWETEIGKPFLLIVEE